MTSITSLEQFIAEIDRAQARAAGFDRHLVKPVDPSEIEAIVESSA